MNASSAPDLLAALVARFPADRRAPLVLGADERLVSAVSCADPAWLAEQIGLRSRRWGTDDRRVLATLWWYSASSWVVGPTLTSLALGDDVLSADPADLELHWLTDSRITGATSSRVLTTGAQVDGAPAVEVAAGTLRRLYDHIIPALATFAEIPPRPLWALAADALATRLLFIGRAVGEVDRVSTLLGPLVDAIGSPMPPTTCRGVGPAMETKRISCCLLYLAPEQSKCSFCPKLRTRAGPPTIP